LGSQVSAAILAGSVLAATHLPGEDGYTTAFLVSAGVALIAALAATLIPRTAESQSARRTVQVPA
jgi:hypothetical protein